MQSARSPGEATPAHPSPHPLWVALAMGIAIALQAWTWSRVEGYEIADVVEYLDRAEAFVRGEALDPGTVRSFAFSALLAPLFWLADLFGLSPSAAVPMARVAQMLTALLAVLLVSRSATRLAGPAAGAGAAFLLALNPVLSQYAVAPLSGTAALCFVALGVDLLLGSPSARRAAGAGAALAGAVLMAYQCLPIAVPILAAGLLRKPWRRAGLWAGAGSGFAALIALQGALDGWVYGSFASSLETYLRQNVYGTLASKLYSLGIEGPARYLYARMEVAPTGDDVRSQLPRNWYMVELMARCLPAPVLSFLLLGAFAALARGRRFALVLLAIAAVNVWLMSAKGSKSFRLWLPLLPLLALVGGLGFGMLWRAKLPAHPLRVLAAVGLLLGLWLGKGALERVNLTKHGAYWDAVSALEEALADERGAEPLRYASAYHWAARFRGPTWLELTKLPHYLDRWRTLEEPEREELLAALEGLDAFIGHQQTFSQDPRIFEAVNRRFEVLAVVDRGASMEDLEPVFVLRRRTGAPTARTFFEVGPTLLSPAEVDAYLRTIAHPVRQEFARVEPDGTRPSLTFLGFDVSHDLAGGRQAWVTYHFLGGADLAGRNYTIVDRFTDGLGAGWNHNHQPAQGAWPTSSWREGEVVRESFLTDWSDRPGEFGGSFLRGPKAPVRLWMAVVEFDQEMRQVGNLLAYHPRVPRPLVRRQWEAEGGRVWSPDGLLQVGGFFWPVPPSRRVPDNGRPFPGER